MDKIAIQAALQGTADCRRCAIRDLVLFSSLDEADFESIHRPIDDLRIPKGGVLYHQGKVGNALYTVREGSLKLVQYARDGAQRIVRLLRQGDVAGLEALLGEPYQHDAIALQDVRVCRLPLEVVQRLGRENQRLHHALMQHWQRAVSSADGFLTELSTGPARARMARLLLRLTDVDNVSCVLPSREDIGAMLGITTETASRTIAAFRREGLITEAAGDKVECDIGGLEAVGGD